MANFERVDVSKFRRESNDTGSPEVQAAIFTDKIHSLTEHLRVHKGDNASRRGLIALVQRRRKMLLYLKRRNPDKYSETISELGIRG